MSSAEGRAIEAVSQSINQTGHRMHGWNTYNEMLLVGCIDCF